MKRIKTFFGKAFNAIASWLIKGIEDATTNPTSEFERRLRNQRDRYENNKTLLANLIECEIRDAEAGYTKWRQITKTKARVRFFLRLFLLLLGAIAIASIRDSFSYNLLFLSLPCLIFVGISIYFLYLCAIQPQQRTENYETHLHYLSTLTAEQIYENIDKKNPANYRPIFRSKLDTQAEIYSYFVANFELLQKGESKYYYKPFVDFITNYVEDKEGNRIKIDSCRSAFSRMIESKID